MQFDDPIYKILADIWEETHKLPRPRQYRSKTVRTTLPPFDDLVEQYRSFDNAVSEFLDIYHESCGYTHIDDYLLGALVSRTKVVRPKNNRSRWFLRITKSDKEQIAIIQSYLQVSSYPAKKSKPAKYLRCYEDDLIIAFDHLCRDALPFRDSVHFVRGYIDTHSHFRRTGANTFRLTITGPLVPQVHNFLTRLGAANTSVYDIDYEAKKKETYRMNVHMKSLRKIRDALYPDGCICNEEVRVKIYQA